MTYDDPFKNIQSTGTALSSLSRLPIIRFWKDSGLIEILVIRQTGHFLETCIVFFHKCAIAAPVEFNNMVLNVYITFNF